MWMHNTDDEPLCTTRELRQIIEAPTGGHFVTPTDPYNEVYPRIYVGDAATAKGIQVLKRLGITHVLNAAHGNKMFFVDTSAEFYAPHNIKFMGVPAIDIMSFQLEPYFDQATDFIDDAINRGGKVLVHCLQGISRSATLALAYLMIKKGMTAQDAIRMVRTQREIMPNPGFMQQLCNLNEKFYRLNALSNFCSNTTMAPLCTVRELTTIIVTPSDGYYVTPTEPYNEVYPNLFVGNVNTAMCIPELKRIGITHILNAAQGRGEYYFVDTSADLYRPHEITFLGIPATDMLSFHMEPYFTQAAEFIGAGINTGGKVMVHCREGISRSATLALAYLMIKEGMTAQDATRTVRAKRKIIPIDGFLQQLCNLNEKLQRVKQ